MTTFVNGREVGKLYETSSRPRKADRGHSIVKRSVRVDGLWRERRTITCECGRKMTGWGNRPFYSYIAHLKRENVPL